MSDDDDLLCQMLAAEFDLPTAMTVAQSEGERDEKPPEPVDTSHVVGVVVLVMVVAIVWLVAWLI